MANLEDAILLATQAHRGQRDKNGSPYILHPIRVMCRVRTEIEKMIAVLHDVVEDTPTSLQDLINDGYPPQVVEAIDALSHRPGESYAAFIERLKPNPLARRVKIADIEDNIDPRRLSVLHEKDFERLKRYRQAWEILTSCEKVEGDTTAWLI